MKIGIVGTGRVGSALALGWTQAGHEVRAANRSGDTTPADLIPWAEVIVLAVPWAALDAVAGQIAGAKGTIVIDCTNPIARDDHGLGLAIGHSTSGAEYLAGLLPGARVVKTLNQVGAEVMADATGFPQAPVQFMAGDDEDAKRRVATLLADLGFEPLDAGDLTKARLLEPFALTWINQALVRGKGRNWAFGAMERGA